MAGGCESLNEGINDNPNDITTEAIEARGFLTGAQLGNIQVQVGHLQRISGLWTRQLIGFQSSYLSLDRYNITTAESNSTWNRAYQSTLSQLRTMQAKAESNPQLLAITWIMEAHTIGTMASLFGDVPYREAATEGISQPVFDPQAQVLADLQALLDQAIATLDELDDQLVIPEDLYFAGDVAQWRESAWTLKARYHLQSRDYAAAYAAALNGLSRAENDMLFKPIDDSNPENKNLFWQLAAGSRAGDIGNLKGEQVSYLLRMLSDTASISRVYGKTDEEARLAFYVIQDDDAAANRGIAAATQPMPMITYAENSLILAEAGARTQDFQTGLGHLNDYRGWLNSGGAFPILDPGAGFAYLPLDEDDFSEDGFENLDSIDPVRALIREIIEERYVSGFGTWMPYNDARRLRDSEPDVAVMFPRQPGECFPQRFLYSANEIDANNNAPADPGLCAPTPINQ
jgi:starch-binding outer membrane protein, SusD/RagB family